jgi:hypothetical protein
MHFQAKLSAHPIRRGLAPRERLGCKGQERPCSWGQGEHEGSPVMGVSGELEGPPDLVMQRPNGVLALTDPDHLGTGFGKCQRLGGCNGGAQRPPCQDGVGREIFEFPCITTHILRFVVAALFSAFRFEHLSDVGRMSELWAGHATLSFSSPSLFVTGG